MGPSSCMQSVVDRNFVMRRMTKYITIRHTSTTILQRISTFPPLDSSPPFQLLIKVVYLFFRRVASVWFPDEEPSWTETCCNIHCDVM